MPAKRKNGQVGTPPPVPTRIKAHDHVEIWANDMQASHSPWDFQLSFGTIEIANPQEVRISDHATVHFSPQFMVRVMQTIQKNIARYEQTLGPIKMPKGLERHEDGEMEDVEGV